MAVESGVSGASAPGDVAARPPTGRPPVEGWHAIDLARTFGLGAETFREDGAIRLSRPVPAFPLVPSQVTADGAALRSVPASAFVGIGGLAVAPRSGRSFAKRGPTASANDNVATSSRARSVWRDIFFLAMLAATVVGAFWSGRIHGLQKVIVVPGPTSQHSVVT